MVIITKKIGDVVKQGDERRRGRTRSLNANWSDSATDTGAFKNVGYKNDLTISFSTSLDSIG